MNPAHERRRYPRRAIQFSVKYKVKEGTFRDLVKNMGARGIYVSTRRRIDHGQPIDLQIPISVIKHRLPIVGEVVRCEQAGFAVMFDDPLSVEA